MNDENENGQTEEEGKLTKAERKQARRDDKQREREQAARARKRARLISRGGMLVVAVVIIAGIGWRVARSPQGEVQNIVSEKGIHWHANISIISNGEPVEIPGGIGLGGVHADMHTHRVNDEVHIEMNRAVRENDLRLARFFDIWGERFDSECILDKCNGDEGTVKLTVNGEESGEFDNYVMRDGDRIEIVFE